MEGRRQFFDSIIQFGWITSKHARRKLNTYSESDRRMRVMLSARTLFRRCRAAIRGKNSVRRVCDRPQRATEIPRQSFYSSSRPDVTLLSTPFGTAGSIVQDTIQHAENPKRERSGKGDLLPLWLYEERKSDFSYMPTANLRTALRADRRHAFP